LDLEFSPEQEMLRETVRGLCESYSPLSVVRELENDSTGYPFELWHQLGELDLIGLLLPEEYGGVGMSALEGFVLYEELGRAVVPLPHFVSAVLCGGALVRSGSVEQRAEWLPRIVTGAAIMTPAWFEPENSCGPSGVQLRAATEGSGYRLTGTKRHVAFASAAQGLLVLARTGDAAEDIDLFLVDPKAAGVTLTQQRTISADTQYRVDLDTWVPECDRLGGERSGWRTWHQVMSEACILLAAKAVGGAQYSLDITVQYAKDREQFDKPIGAFQAISHYLADAATNLDGATTLALEAAWASSMGRPVDRLAPMAKLFACRTYRDITAMAQQVFGGIGFTVDFDIQLYFRRAKQLQISWWDESHLEELVARAVLDEHTL